MDLKLVIGLAVLVVLGEARPRFIAFPVEDIRLIRNVQPTSLDEARPLRRHVRSLPDVQLIREVRQLPDVQLIREVRPTSFDQVGEMSRLGYQKVLPPVQELQHHGLESRQGGHGGGYGGDHGGYGNDHVDYGAYTGGYGAFGWYSDHPVCVNCGYGYH